MKKIIHLILISGLIISCNKNRNLELDSGIFRGVYYRLDNGKDTVYQGVANLAISEDNNTFTLVPDVSSSAPLNCYGRYFIKDVDSILFINDAYLNEFFYDDLLILDTIMKFSQIGEELTLEFTRDDTIFYEYVLVRR